MALRERIIEPLPIGRRHRIAEIRDTLDPADLEVLDRWLNDPAIGSRRIAEELCDESPTLSVSPNAVTRYRREVLGVKV